MQAIRHLFAQRHLAVLICAAALLMKLVIPTGYMIGSDHGRPSIILCSGIAPMTMAMDTPEMADAMAGHGQGPHDRKDHEGAGMPCPYASMSAAMLDTVDPIQLAALVAFVMAIGLAAAVLPTPFGAAYLRPPLRGPPTQP